MRRADGPWATSITVAAVSNPALTNTATAVTSLVLVPALQVLMLVAVTASVGSPDLVGTAYAGIVLAFGLGVLSGTVEQVTRDRRLGVVQDVLGHGIANPVYWGGKLVVPVVLGIVPALAGAGVVFWLDGARDVDALSRTLVLVPVAALAGGMVGLAAAVISLALSDPYVVANSACSVLLLTAGVVLPLGLYPEWLAWTARALPFTAVIEAVRADGPVGVLVLRELGVCAVWLGGGVVAGRRVLSAWRSGRRTEEVW
ncbi:ABC transporter permease [Cellulomonas triticagri]|uniref:ABC transporter permease n=1 Tax=Cellulomonas triticagri TaxID=2483352 RepID=A0A3M2J6F0_9CELL|nr:ABC transporter permease [Cellulomonas triticagri]RMI09687.1 ABC transporter permease [Cellulomonas triticagri]